MSDQEAKGRIAIAWSWALVAMLVIGVGVYEQFWTNDRWWDIGTNYVVGILLLGVALFEYGDSDEPWVDLTDDHDA